jgi:hypothetical protein
MHPELKPILIEWQSEWQKIHNKWLERNISDEKRVDRKIMPDHQWVFVHPLRHGRRADRFTKSFEQARRDAGLPEMTSHTFRHYFISHCVMSGINFFTIAKWVGHSNSRMGANKTMDKNELVLKGKSGLRGSSVRRAEDAEEIGIYPRQEPPQPSPDSPHFPPWRYPGCHRKRHRRNKGRMRTSVSRSL